VTRQREDDGLRERFQELRGESARQGGLPDFDAMIARARAEATGRPTLGLLGGAAWRRGGPATDYRRLARAGAWASFAVAATVAGLLLTDRRPREAEFERLVAAYATDASAGAWRSPTASLLAVPGMELTRSMPSIGGPVRGLDPSTLPAREPAQEERS
jgi:hypothetical protein